MIDLHTHVLPGIDDGPATMDAAIAIARAAVDHGIETMVVTPHVSWDVPDNDAALIAERLGELTRELAHRQVSLRLCPGAEISLTRAVELDDDELVRLRLGRGRWLLVECPFTASGHGFEEMLDTLRARGHEIVLAHPERCAGFLHDHDLLRRLVGQGMLCSLTASSISGRFGRRAARYSRELLRDGLVHNIASDCHSATGRPPVIFEHLDVPGARERAEWLTHDVPAAIIAGSPLPDPPPLEATDWLGRRRRR